jgi:hypothetical protein
MKRGSLTRRLEQIEARLTPDDERVLEIVVTRIGEPDRIILVSLPPVGRRWQYRPGRGGDN